MANSSLTVALFIYNRPQLTRRVFARIRAAPPARLFVIADGPGGRADNAELEAARMETENIDWPCRVERDSASNHLGCGRRVSSGIASVLEQAQEAVFLEDDCLPDPSFFTFCKELLVRYRDRSEILMISGYNPLDTVNLADTSYDFSRFGSIWGWASWKRAFSGYDRELACWDDAATRQRLRDALQDDSAFEYYGRVVDRIRNGQIDTWDYQWTIYRLLQGGLCAVPTRNLVQNMGFGGAATHTGSANLLHLENHAESLEFPLQHPAQVKLNRVLDQRLLMHRLGLPYADDLNAAAEKLLAAGRNAQLMALMVIAQKRFPEDQRFLQLRVEALQRIGQKDRARQEIMGLD